MRFEIFLSFVGEGERLRQVGYGGYTAVVPVSGFPAMESAVVGADSFRDAQLFAAGQFHRHLRAVRPFFQ